MGCHCLGVIAGTARAGIRAGVKNVKPGLPVYFNVCHPEVFNTYMNI